MMRKITFTTMVFSITLAVCIDAGWADDKKPAKPVEITATQKGKIVHVATDGSGDYNCDGTDDHVEINQAIQAVNKAGGGTVRLKKGLYIINDSVTLCSNLVFEGQGQEATIVKVRDKNNKTGWSHIQGNKVSKTLLQRFTVDGNQKGQTIDPNVAREGGTHGIRFIRCDHVTVQHVTCRNVFTDGFKFSSSSDCVVRHCKAWWLSHDGYVTGACKRITFADNLAWKLGAHGVRLYNSSDCVVERNRLYGGDYGILESAQGTGKHGNNIFRDNYINNTKFANYSAIAIETSKGTTFDNDLFLRNIIDTCFGHGIYIGTGYTGGTVSNLKITNCVINKCRGSGICANPSGRGKAGPTRVVNCVAKNCIIINCGVRESGKLPETHGRGIYGNVISQYNNIWNNAGGGYGGGARKGAGDISENPLFVGQTKFKDTSYKGGAFGWSAYIAFIKKTTEDFHLHSKAGRWDAKTKKWVKDAANSPCIDAGGPKSEHKNEPKPNGGRINMGAHGNTPKASKSADRTTGNDRTAKGAEL